MPFSKKNPLVWDVSFTNHQRWSLELNVHLLKQIEAYPSRLHLWIDYLNIEPASRFKNAIMNWLLEKIEPTSRSKNIANGFNVKKKTI